MSIFFPAVLIDGGNFFKLTEAEPASVFGGGFPPVRRQSP